MKKTFAYLVVALFMMMGASVKAQDDCTTKYNLFKGDYKTKKYADAKTKLGELMQSCAKLSVNIYVYGAKIATKTKDHDLMKKVYETRLVNFPKKKVAKAHDDYAEYLIENNLASDDEIFAILEKAYESDPTSMGVKNIYRYFEGVVKRNKDTDPQKVFDTYDDVVESVGEKLDDYSKKIEALKAKEAAGSLDKKEQRNLKAYTINSKALGQVEGGLDAMIETIATCERLIPIYSRDFESKKADATWLRRAVSRLHHKGCQSDPLYEKLAKSYAEVAHTADAYMFVAGVLDKKGDEAGAKSMRKKAFDLETDPNKKAKMKLTEAFDAASSGRRGKARSLAYEALKLKPNLGKAYLLIASLYAKSANSCGTDVFEKRMVYVAALNKARKAQSVDPGSGAGRYIASYKKNIPSKKDVFQKGIASGSSHKIGCWIGETVLVP